MATYVEQRETNDNSQQVFQLPRNVRQLGNIQGNTKIYMEDFVYTFLHGNSVQENWEYRGCILLGNTFTDRGQKILLISGAVCIPDQMFSGGCPEFSDRMWGNVYQNIKQYFDQVEILGWGMDVSGTQLKLTSELEKVHRNAFSNQEQLLFLMDRMEDEEAFYVYEKNMLRRKEGYYIYYEKNPQMREYMLRNSVDAQPVLEVDPQQNIMNQYRAKQEALSAKKGRGLRNGIYVASLALVAFMAAVGVNQITSSQKMKELETTISYLGDHEKNIESEIPTSETSSAIKEDGQEEKALLTDDESKQDPTDNTELINIIDENDEAEDHTTTDAAITTEQKKEDQPKAEAQDAQKEEDQSEAEAQDAQEEETQPTTKQVEFYTVQKGDSLLSISKKIYGENRVKELVKRNNLENEDKIYEGQELILLDK